MKKELDVAVDWWASQLGGKPKFDNGDALHGALASLIKIDPLSKQQIDSFKENFKKELRARFKEEDWREDNPSFASYHRCIGVDYGPDLSLSKACEASGFKASNRFPVKTNMWIDPGCVKVSCGYRSPIEVLWKSSPAEEE